MENGFFSPGWEALGGHGTVSRNNTLQCFLGMIRIHVQYRSQNRGCGQATLGLSSSPASPYILFFLKLSNRPPGKPSWASSRDFTRSQRPGGKDLGVGPASFLCTAWLATLLQRYGKVSMHKPVCSCQVISKHFTETTVSDTALSFPESYCA